MLRRTAPAVLITLMCALGLVGISAMTWVSAAVDTSLQQVSVVVKGSDAATAVTALGLVAAAAALAFTVSGRMLRAVVGVVVAFAGVGAAISTYAVVHNPEATSRTTVGQETGVVGAAGDYVLSVWPWVGIVVALALVLCGVWLVLVARHTVRKAPRRYDRAAKGSDGDDNSDDGDYDTDDIDAWDALTRGTDPTR